MEKRKREKYKKQHLIASTTPINADTYQETASKFAKNFLQLIIYI
jgi:hypothetical protein